MNRIIVVSNRLPFTVERCGDELQLKQSAGGLVTALQSFFDRDQQTDSHRIWVGSVAAEPEEWERIKPDEKAGFDTEPVFIPKPVYDAYYNDLSNSTIWPLFHYFPSLTQYSTPAFEAYKEANALFAQKIIDIYQPGDVLWVHDYQLMLVPQMVRKQLPHAIIGFFLHIPFPSYEIFRLMPTQWKKVLLEGVLGADLVGFHTHDYVQHFIQSAKMVLQLDSSFNTISYKDRLIRADLFPIGIDYQKFRQAITNDVVAHLTTKIEQRFTGYKIIFSVDRLDYTKGIEYRLDGYSLFLERYPEWRERVVFILNLIPSRNEIDTYIKRKKDIEEKISTLNGRWATLDWQPILYRHNHLDFEELCALYQSADAALITPLRDGMNLVAKEYVASCLDKGVLILSELTGAASELSEAVVVNPTDSEEVSDAIYTALNLPAQEQRSRLRHMQMRLQQYDVIKWVNDFLEVLRLAKIDQQKMAVKIFDARVQQTLEAAFLKASSRCILLDYDGTLAPYQRLPEQAAPGTAILESLTQLCADERNHVVIISGRDAETLERWLGHLPLSLVAEHGAAIKYVGTGWAQQASVAPEWKEQIRPLMELFVTRCVGSFIEEKKNTLAWHYRNTHPDLGFVRSRELNNSLLQLTTNTALQVMDGNKVVEVRLMGINKGATALKLKEHFIPDFILCIGDDTTDEDMFRVLKENAFTIKIGGGNTAAQCTLSSQQEVLPLLNRLVALQKRIMA